ncbi:DUF4157 domain-containing protein [Mucilaginibacter sp. OK098]|uniref:eCIS core domain-containing protein n=1 Tax=Mucilaginibacter sp. OK098 TaxID=1855297 RepID=UPI000919D7FF|nr:DUF4157 domain-containing protein [Mucilaginibacter sp. OK098]SHN27361.1 protein of unknown function [Mucilaginibacter sp. OK098]
MYENTSIANQSESSPAALANKAMHPPVQFDPETDLKDRLPVQLKLSVGASNDPLEYEADAMADKVMRMPETSFIQRKAGCSCSDYDDEHVRLKPLASQITPLIQAKGDGAGIVSDAVSGKIKSSMGGGSSIQSDTKSFMESRFGADFSGVKIHDDSMSAGLNHSLSAKAFTAGNHIYFNNGQYQPQAHSGRHLLAHELTHTLQQSGSGTPGIIRRTPSDDARALSKRIHDDLSATKPNVTDVLAALNTLNRDETKATLLKTTYKKDNTTDLDADIKLHITGADLNRALFLLNAPPAETSFLSMVNIDRAGNEDHKAKVGGGEVSVHTNVGYSGKSPGSSKTTDGFSIAYAGAKADDSHYIQTMWTEIIATQPDNTQVWVDKTAVSVNGYLELTTDPKKPKYKVDSTSKTPFYDHAGSKNRTDTSIIDFDRPSDDKKIILEQFDAKATKVVEIDHFDNFLIQEGKAIYQVSLYIQWEYTSKTAMVRSTKFVSGGAISAIPAEIKKQIVKEYPNYEYLT